MDQFKQACENNLIGVLDILSDELRQRYNIDVSTSELMNILNKDSSSSSGKSNTIRKVVSVNSRPAPVVSRSTTTTTSTKAPVVDGDRCIAIVEKTKERCGHPINKKVPECEEQRLCGMHLKVWKNDSSKLKTILNNDPTPSGSKSSGKVAVAIPRGRIVAAVPTSAAKGPKTTKVMVNEDTDVDFKAVEMEEHPGYFITDTDLIYVKLPDGNNGLVGKIVQDEYVAIQPKEAAIYRSDGWVILELENPDDIFGGYKTTSTNKISVTPSAKANGVANGTAVKLATAKSGVSRVIKSAAPTKVIEEDTEEPEPEPVKPAAPKAVARVPIGVPRSVTVKAPVSVPVKAPVVVAAPKKASVVVPRAVVKVATKPTVVEEEPESEEQVEESVEETQQNGDANEEEPEEAVEQQEDGAVEDESEQVDE